MRALAALYLEGKWGLCPSTEEVLGRSLTRAEERIVGSEMDFSDPVSWHPEVPLHLLGWPHWKWGAGWLFWCELVGAVAQQRHRNTCLHLFSSRNHAASLEKSFFINCRVISTCQFSRYLVHPPENVTLSSDVLLLISVWGAFSLSRSSCSKCCRVRPCYRKLSWKEIFIACLMEANVSSEGGSWTPICPCTFSCIGKMVLCFLFQVCTLL